MSLERYIPQPVLNQSVSGILLKTNSFQATTFQEIIRRYFTQIQLLIMTHWMFDFSGFKLSLSHESHCWQESAANLLHV